jgi:hypothetical protein
MLNTNTIMGMLLGASLLGVGGMVGYAVGLKHAPNTGFGTATTVYPPAVSDLYPPVPRSNTAGGTGELARDIQTMGKPTTVTSHADGHFDCANPRDSWVSKPRAVLAEHGATERNG